MKEIKSRYATKKVNSNFFGTVEVKNADVNTVSESEKNLDKGYFFAPFILVTSNEKSLEYEKFMKKYREEREKCPICGSESYTTTLIGYIFNSSEPEKYKDENLCTCQSCGDQRTYHERKIN